MVHRSTAPLVTFILLFGLAGTVVAQPSADGEPEPPLFVVVMDPSSDGTGQFTPFAEIEGGTVELVEDFTDLRQIGGVLRLDPSPRGGDTFDVRTTGRQLGPTVTGGTHMVDLTWDILSGTGDFVDLTGSGAVLMVLQPGRAFSHALYLGSTGHAIRGTELARENWDAIRTHFKIKKLRNRGFDITRTHMTQTKKLKKLRRQNQKDVDFLKEIGSQPCYAEGYELLLQGLEGIDGGLASKMEFVPESDFFLSSAYSRIDEFDMAADAVKC